jgi:hypothetical protein
MKHTNTTIPGNPETCEHPLHCLVLISASNENRMDTSYTRNWATLECIACGKTIPFYTYSGLGGTTYYRDEKEVPK